MAKQQNNIMDVVSVVLNAFESGKFGANKVHEILNPVFGGTLPFNAVEGVCLAFENGIKDINIHISTLSMLASFEANKSNQGAAKLVAGNNSVVIGGNNTGNISIVIGGSGSGFGGADNDRGGIPEIPAVSYKKQYSPKADSTTLRMPNSMCKYLTSVAKVEAEDKVTFCAIVEDQFSDEKAQEVFNFTLDKEPANTLIGRAVLEILKQTTATGGCFCIDKFDMGSVEIKKAVYEMATQKDLNVRGMSTNSKQLDDTQQQLRNDLCRLWHIAIKKLGVSSQAESGENQGKVQMLKPNTVPSAVQDEVVENNNENPYAVPLGKLG